MRRLIILAITLCFTAACVWPVLSVLAGHGPCKTCPDCGCKVCVAEPEIVKEKKHCWNVECKDICIPHFKWPWESCCTPPKCGRVKTVKVLKKVEYECEKCGCKWHVTQVDCCDCDRCAK